MKYYMAVNYVEFNWCFNDHYTNYQINIYYKFNFPDTIYCEILSLSYYNSSYIIFNVLLNEYFQRHSEIYREIIILYVFVCT